MSKKFAAITGIGAWLPPDKLTNAELEQRVDTSGEWIVERTGIEERRVLKEEGKGVSYMAANAVKDLLKKSGTNPAKVDLLILTTVNPDYKFPNAASLVCRETGLTNAYGFDINATCSGFIYALEIGRRFIESGAYDKIIVASSEKMSATTDPMDRASIILFGDGAGAVLLEPSERYGILDIVLKTDGAGAENIIAKTGGSAYAITKENIDEKLHFFTQDGKMVFKDAVIGMEAICREILDRNRLNAGDIDWIVAHQANLRIIESIAKRLDVPMEKMLVNIQLVGNTSSASIPLCLYDHKDKLKKGDKIILTAFGSGYVWGGVLLVWAG